VNGEHEWKITEVSIDDLLPYPGNARKGDVERIKESIEVNGFYAPLVVQRSTGHVLVGNHRMKAARELKYAKLPVIYVDVDDTAARKIVLADNRTSDDASYDTDLLLELLTDLPDLEGTGYSHEDLDALAGIEQLPEPGDAEITDGDLDIAWGVIITCTSEKQQAALLERLAREGLDVRALQRG
jgi:ParB-like chromosome segregation protein Spo0J